MRLAHRADLRELLDDAPALGHELEQNLRDIRRINRWLGWNRATVRELGRQLCACDGARWSLIDVATGSGDLPLAIERWAFRRGHQPLIVANDLSEAVLVSAARQVGRGHRVALLRADGLRLPLRDASIDVVTCALALHHFAPAGAIELLRELGRVTRRALVLSDLERCWSGYIGARLLGLLTRNRMTRHDAPVSVRRAYTAPELRTLARAAGLAGARVCRRFPARLVLTWRRAAGSQDHRTRPAHV